MTVVSGHIGLLLVLDILFAILQPRSLAGRQRTVFHAIRDPVLLVRLAAIHFVDARMAWIDLARALRRMCCRLGFEQRRPQQTSDHPLPGLRATS